MADERSIPKADDILGPALDKLYEVRPATFPFVNDKTGVYWHVFNGFRGQATTAIKSLSDRVLQSRLGTCPDIPSLLRLLSSEFEAYPDVDPSRALGKVSISRPAPSVGTAPGGVIKAGSRVTRNAETVAAVTFAAATFQTTRDIVVAPGQLTVTDIPIEALAAGTTANLPFATDSATIATFASFTVDSMEAAGGSGGPDVVSLIRYAKAYSRGRAGATQDEAVYAALRTTGARHAVAFDNPVDGTLTLVVADGSWGHSDQFTGSVRAAMASDGYIGHGCVVSLAPVVNRQAYVTPTIAVRDSNYLQDPSALYTSARATTQSYFDDRLDWNVWDKDTLKALITTCDDRILQCTDVAVVDENGATIAETDASSDQHVYMVSFTPNFVAPF